MRHNINAVCEKCAFWKHKINAVLQKNALRVHEINADWGSRIKKTCMYMNEEDETEVEADRESTKSRKIGVPTIDEIELKEVPMYMICPKCGEKGVTRTTVESSKEAECVSLCLCLLQ